MHVWSCDRRRFVDFMANGKKVDSREVRIVTAIEEISFRNEITLIWKQDPSEQFVLPNAVIVPEGSVPDFLAWVSTYFRQFRPFTAHCRVLTPRLLSLLVHSLQPVPTPDVRSADLGLILAEGISYSVGRAEPARLPISAYFRTLSYAYSEGLKRYGKPFISTGLAFEEIKNGWLKARDFGNYPSLELHPTVIQDVWTAIACVAIGNGTHRPRNEADPLVVEALQGIYTNGRILTETLRKLTELCEVDLSEILALMDGPREERVKMVDIAIRTLAQGSESTRKHRAFTAGYFASLIQPGSLDHFPVLFPIATRLRESFLWYGACAGLTPETSIMNYGDGIGWYLKRELERSFDWLERPHCDVALAEMVLLFRNREGGKTGLRTQITGALKVEIFPLVHTIFKWNGPVEGVVTERSSFNQQKTLFDEDQNQLKQDVLDLLRKVEESTVSLNAIRKHVERRFGEKTPKLRNKNNQ